MAVELAACWLFPRFENNDGGLILFTDQIEQYIPPKKDGGMSWGRL